MADKKKRMPTRRKGSLPGPRNKRKINPSRTPIKPSAGNVRGIVKSGQKFLDGSIALNKKIDGVLGGMTIGRATAHTVTSLAPAIGRAAKAAGTSLIRDYQGSKVQQRFEGTPITVETKFETESSPVKYPKTDAFRSRQAEGRTPPRGTISYPDEGTANAPRRKKRQKDLHHYDVPLPANTGRRR